MAFPVLLGDSQLDICHVYLAYTIIAQLYDILVIGEMERITGKENKK